MDPVLGKTLKDTKNQPVIKANLLSGMLSGTSVLSKMLFIVGLLGLIYAGSVWYAQSRLTTINDSYASYIAREAKGAASARHLNRLIFEANYWVFRAIAETDEGQLKRADEEFSGALSEIKLVLADLRQQASSFSGQIDALAERLDRYSVDLTDVRGFAVENKKELALTLMRETIDPTFNDMVQSGSKLGSDILALADRRC